MDVAASRPSSGFTLIELMVSVVLSAILMSGAVSIYLASKRSYEEVENVAALAENAGYAEDILNDSIRHTGFFGEVAANRVEVFPGTPAVASDCTGRAAAYDIDNYLHAESVDNSGNAIGCISGAVPDTDVLVIKRVRPLPYTDGPRVQDPNSVVPKTGTINEPSPGLTAQTTYVMTNNTMAYLFENSEVVPSTIGDVPDGVAWEYEFEAYYIREDTVPTLSRIVLADEGSGMTVVSEDVVHGVENMRVLFGYDSDDDGEVDAYANLDDIGTNWDSVLSVEIFVLMRSATADFQYEDEKIYTLGDITVTPTDRNFRRLISRASVSMRNPQMVIRGGAT